MIIEGNGDDREARRDGEDDVVMSAGVLLVGAQDTRPTDPASVDRLRANLASLGFDVTGVFAGTFSVTGSSSLFCRVFPTVRDQIDRRAAPAGTGEVDLPVHELAAVMDDDLDDVVAAIFFSAPPDFGPGNP